MRHKEGDKFNAILDAAIKVFRKDGFAGAQVAAIAKQADVATGSVYLYFANKDAVLDGVFDRFWLPLLDEMEVLDQSSPQEFLRAQLGLFFDRLSEQRDLAEVYLREHHHYLEHHSAKGYDAYERCVHLGALVFSKGVKSGVFAKGIEVPLGRAYVFGGVRAALEFWLGQSALSARQVRNRMLRLTMASLIHAAEDDL